MDWIPLGACAIVALVMLGGYWFASRGQRRILDPRYHSPRAVNESIDRAQAKTKGEPPFHAWPADRMVRTFEVYEIPEPALPRKTDPFEPPTEATERARLILDYLYSGSIDLELQRKHLIEQGADEGMGG